MDNKEKKSRLFEKTFLLTDISIDIALEIVLFILKKVEIDLVGHQMY